MLLKGTVGILLGNGLSINLSVHKITPRWGVSPKRGVISVALNLDSVMLLGLTRLRLVGLMANIANRDSQGNQDQRPA